MKVKGCWSGGATSPPGQMQAELGGQSGAGGGVGDHQDSAENHAGKLPMAIGSSVKCTARDASTKF